MSDQPRLERLDHVALMVDNIDAAARWYMDLLGLEPYLPEEWWDETGHYLALKGDFVLALLPRGDFEAKPIPPQDKRNRFPHLAFRVCRATWDSYRTCLAERPVLYEIHDYDIAYSLYFTDSDNNVVELTTREVEPRLPKEMFAEE